VSRRCQGYRVKFSIFLLLRLSTLKYSKTSVRLCLHVCIAASLNHATILDCPTLICFDQLTGLCTASPFSKPSDAVNLLLVPRADGGECKARSPLNKKQEKRDRYKTNRPARQAVALPFLLSLACMRWRFFPHLTSFIILTPMKQSIFVVLALLILAPACRQQRKGDNLSISNEIIVASAANLTDAFGELGKQFTSQTGIRVTFSFGSTAELAKQIENGAPFDVFAAADVEHIDKLDHLGLLTPGTRAVYARGRLVMWIPAGSRVSINRVEDITREEIGRIAIAKPDVAPYGQAAVESLRALNLWAQIEPKVIYGQNVSQTKQYVATGNAEVAFIPLALVKPGEGNYVELDERLHQPIDQALAVVGGSMKQRAGSRFVEFVLSSEGQMLLQKHGYDLPPAQR
jgi:molybdate transport system substrate-binding protein